VRVIDAMVRLYLPGDMTALNLWHGIEGPGWLLKLQGGQSVSQEMFLAAANDSLQKAVEHGVKWVQALDAGSFVVIATLKPAAAFILQMHLSFAEHRVSQVSQPRALEN
jgi:hypothetical protein